MKFKLPTKKDLKGYKRELILSGVLIFSLIFFIAQTKITSRSNENFRIEKAKFQEIESEAENLEVLKSKYRELEKHLAELQNMLPREEKFSEFLSEIARLAEENRIKVISMRPVSKEKQDPYQKISISVEAQGGYHNFGRFLNKLEYSTKSFVSVQNFLIQSNPYNPDPQSHKINMLVTTFRLLEKGE